MHDNTSVAILVDILEMLRKRTAAAPDRAEGAPGMRPGTSWRVACKGGAVRILPASDTLSHFGRLRFEASIISRKLGRSEIGPRLAGRRINPALMWRCILRSTIMRSVFH